MSKREQVQGVRSLGTTSPVARLVDTYTPKKPEKDENKLGQLLNSLSKTTPALNRIYGEFQKQDAAADKLDVETMFAKDAIQAIEQVRTGEMPAYLSPVSKFYAAELAGKNLGTNFGTQLQKDFASTSGLMFSENPEEFEEWLEGQRIKFVEDNNGLFRKQGVINGFQTKLNEVTSNLRKTAVSVASKNFLTRTQDAFEARIYTLAIGSNPESMTEETLNENGEVVSTVIGSGVVIAQAVEDHVLAMGITDLKEVNYLVRETVIKAVVENINVPASARIKILPQLLNAIPTSSGNNLGSTPVSQAEIAEAAVTMINAEAKLEELIETKEANLRKEQMRNLTDRLFKDFPDGGLSVDQFTDLLGTPEFNKIDKRKALKLFNTMQEDRKTATQIDPSVLVSLRAHLLGMPKTEALKLLYSEKGLKMVGGDLKAFEQLRVQVTGQADLPTDYSKNENYKTFYRLLGGGLGTNQLNVNAANDQPIILERREMFIKRFFQLFVEEAWRKSEEKDQFDSVLKIYQEIKATLPLTGQKPQTP